MDNIIKSKPTPQEKQIYDLLSSKEGQEFMDWLRKKTIERQVGLGVQDGIQTALLTHREVGRCDIYHEITRLLFKVSSYVNRK